MRVGLYREKEIRIYSEVHRLDLGSLHAKVSPRYLRTIDGDSIAFLCSPAHDPAGHCAREKSLNRSEIPAVRISRLRKAGQGSVITGEQPKPRHRLQECRFQ